MSIWRVTNYMILSSLFSWWGSFPLCRSLIIHLSCHWTKPTKWHAPSEDSDQSLRCPHEATLGSWLPIERIANKNKDSDQSLQAELSLLWAHMSFCHEVAHYVCRSSNPEVLRLLAKLEGRPESYAEGHRNNDPYFYSYDIRKVLEYYVKR